MSVEARVDRGGRESRYTRRDASTGPQAQASSEGGKEGLREEREKGRRKRGKILGWNDSRSAAQLWCAGAACTVSGNGLGAEGR